MTAWRRLLRFVAGRRWLRFSLRTLAVVILVLGAALGWLAKELHQNRREQAIAEQLRARHVQRRAKFDPVQFERPTGLESPQWFYKLQRQLFKPHVVGIRLREATDQDLLLLAELEHLSSLRLGSTEIRNLAPLAGLRNLETLCIDDTRVSDLTACAGYTNLQKLKLALTDVKDLGPLKELRKLHHLELAGTYVSDVSPLAELTLLESLDLKGTLVSDIAPLKGLTRLKWLDIGGTQVRDLRSLAGLKDLTALYLHRIPVSQNDVAELQKALPNCTMVGLAGAR